MENNRIVMIWMFVAACILTGCGNGRVQMSLADNTFVEDTEADNLKEDFGSSTSEYSMNREEESEADQVSSELKEGKTTEDCIYVYVCGHVAKPGVYTLQPEARICDAISLAGGVLEDGRGEALNQAEHVTDGQTLYVPGKDEELNGAGSVTVGSSEADGRIDINLATKEELMTLPGIGESKALTIIQYREEHGAFEKIEGLMEIPGIKEGVYNKIKEQIKVGPSSISKK